MKTIFCNNHCGTEIYFSDQHVSKSGKKIPLEVKTQQPHKCPNNPYNKKEEQKHESLEKTPEQKEEEIKDTFVYEMLTADEKLIISINTRWLLEVRHLISEICPKNTSGAEIGQILNLVVDKFNNMKKTSDSEHD